MDYDDDKEMGDGFVVPEEALPDEEVSDDEDEDELPDSDHDEKDWE